MSLGSDDKLKYVFYEEARDRYRCIVKGKYIKSALELDDVIDARDEYLEKNGIDLTEVGVSKHPLGHWIYRRTIDGVRYEIYTSKDKETVLRAKGIFDERIQSKKISIPQIQSITDNGDEPDRRKVRGIAKDDAAIWGDNFVFIRKGET